ncbi:hypothetical protein V7148_03945 [Gottfriedia acidiceleris]|uniref:hypothetical protein n=1 Tax=Gottfriedia acidiceleris TaxID=371036 RepID=UPI002FFED79B
MEKGKSNSINKGQVNKERRNFISRLFFLILIFFTTFPFKRNGFLLHSANVETFSKDNHNGTISVLEYGADPTGEKDSTLAFKNAIKYARNQILFYNFKSNIQVLIPGGIYKISEKLIFSPYIHIKTQGFVIINTTVSNGSTIHFTAQEDDPPFLHLMSKQQYHRSPLINAADGGMLIRSTLDKSKSLAIGIEIGSHTNLGTHLPTSRYSFCDIAIENFDIAIQMNIFNNFIGTFSNLHLEGNNMLIRFGTKIENVINSGENFTFYNGVFAGAKIGFEWLVDGMDCNFYGCSFDFIDTVFKFKRGYKRIGVWGGHIEGIKSGNGQGIGVSFSEDDVWPQLYLSSPVINCNGSELFKGALNLTCDNVRWETTKVLANTSSIYLCDFSVCAREVRHQLQGFERVLSPNNNLIQFSRFKESDLSINSLNLLNEFNITKKGYTDPVVTSSIPTGTKFSKAIIIFSNENYNTWFQLETKDYFVRPGEFIQMCALVYDNGTDFRNVNFHFKFLDTVGNEISTTDNYANKEGLYKGQWNGVFSKLHIVPPGASTVKGYCIISKHKKGEKIYISELYMGLS